MCTTCGCSWTIGASTDTAAAGHAHGEVLGHDPGHDDDRGRPQEHGHGHLQAAHVRIHEM